jgi:hypothetical protein
MVLHLYNEEDLHFKNEKIEEIFEAMKYVYFKYYNVNMPIFEVDVPTLDVFKTTIDDI